LLKVNLRVDSNFLRLVSPGAGVGVAILGRCVETEKV
jgi:hypothetical protein